MSALTQSPNALVPTSLEPKTKESDKTFSNLGLDDYLTSMENLGNDKAAVNNKNDTSLLDCSGRDKSLSLQDKQR